MVNEIRVPSSSSSSSVAVMRQYGHVADDIFNAVLASLTDGDGLDPDTLLDVCVGGIIGILALEYFLPAEGIDERSTTCGVVAGSVSRISDIFQWPISRYGSITHRFLKHRRPSNRTGFPS